MIAPAWAASDDCGSATPIESGIFVGTTVGSTNDGSASCGSSSSTADVWYRYSATADGLVIFSNYDSSYDSVLSLHSGCPGTTDNQLSCTDPHDFPAVLEMTTGEQVVIRISGYNGSTGEYSLNVGLEGSISGTVIDHSSGLPIEDAAVDIFHSSGLWLGTGFTGPGGDYSLGGLPSGSYFAVTDNGAGFVDELYDDFTCPGGACNFAIGTEIEVASGSETANINFALALGGAISGTITDQANGLPIYQAKVNIFDSSGEWVLDEHANWEGIYTVEGLPAGIYFALTDNWAGYANELYDDIDCSSSCDVTTGTPIGVTVGSEASEIAFALVELGTISGRITDTATGKPIVDAHVDIYDSSGNYMTSGHPNSQGHYTSSSGLPTGTYFAKTSNWVGFIDELYDDIECSSGCDVTTGTPIGVTAGAETSGIDFALGTMGRISGTVTDQSTGLPIRSVYVRIYDGSGEWVTSARTNSQGIYTSRGLAPGTHFVATSNEDSYLDELYDDIDCWSGCDVTAGTPITVTFGFETPGIDFALAPGGSIGGTITDQSSGLPIEDVHVSIYDSSGNYITQGRNQGDGTYTSLSSFSLGLPTGTYFALAVSYHREGYLDELYDDIDCWSGCDVTAGTPIGVTAGSETPGIDFALALGSSISGTVTAESSGAPIANTQARIFDSSGTWVASDFTDATGTYREGGLVPGTYFVLTHNIAGYVDELFDDFPCPGRICDVTTGTTIELSLGFDAFDVDFALLESEEILADGFESGDTSAWSSTVE